MKKLLVILMIVFLSSYAQAASITLTIDDAKIARVRTGFSTCDPSSVLTGNALVKHCIRAFVIQKIYEFEHNSAINTAAATISSDDTLVDP